MSNIEELQKEMEHYRSREDFESSLFKSLTWLQTIRDEFLIILCRLRSNGESVLEVEEDYKAAETELKTALDTLSQRWISFSSTSKEYLKEKEKQD